MWPRNLLFVTLCLFGAGTLAVSLLPTNRLAEPTDFDPQRASKDGFGDVVQRINSEFREHWQLSDVNVAPQADGLLIARRLSLGLTGTIPSLEEIRVLESKPTEQRVEWWLSHLLEDRRYADYVAERLARAFVGVEDGPFLAFRRRRFATWIADQLARNKPYDELARALISDNGLWTDSPAVNFTTVTLGGDQGGPDPVRLAARTTRAFLGMRIDCLQCHDNHLPDPFPLGSEDDMHDGLQQDFHQLAAFYCEASMAVGGVRDNKGEKYNFQFLYDDKETEVEPKFPYLNDVEIRGATHRERLANWVTHPENKPFARAIVNRTWALLFGQPLTKGIDDVPLQGQPLNDTAFVQRVAALATGQPLALPVNDIPARRFANGLDNTRWWSGDSPFPPAMETLADDFIQHGYDLRRLIRLIAATEVFQLDSAADFTVTKQYEHRRSVFAHTRLRPEQFAGAVLQSSSLSTNDANSHIVSQLQTSFQQSAFINRYGDTGEDEFSQHGGTMPQRLQVMNGELTQSKFNNVLTNAASQITAFAPDDQAAVETAFLVTLTRRPLPDESQYFLDRLAGTKGDQRARVIEDLFWELWNTTEFMWNH